MPVFLEALAIQFFRGIGPDTQKLGPFKSFNFFVGANNSGKSTVLDFLHRYLSGQNTRGTIDAVDRYTGKKTGELSSTIGLSAKTFAEAALRSLSEPARRNYTRAVEAICDVLAQPDQFIWIIPGKAPTVSPERFNKIRGVLSDGEWNQLWKTLTNMQGGGLQSAWIPQTIGTLYAAQKTSLPPVKFIPTNREIGDLSGQFNDFSGRGLIARLAELQSPDHDKREELLLFNKINLFLQTVVGRPDAKIEIPHSRRHVLVHMDEKVLPLSSSALESMKL